jgi:RimJ/RimL family protein N-acetyltransferase
LPLPYTYGRIVNNQFVFLSSSKLFKTESEARTQGHGKESTLLLLRYAIQHLNVTSFTAKISLKNAPSRKLFETWFQFKEVSVSEIFQEVTLERIVDDAWKQWVMEKAEWELGRYEPEI